MGAPLERDLDFLSNLARTGVLEPRQSPNATGLNLNILMLGPTYSTNLRLNMGPRPGMRLRFPV